MSGTIRQGGNGDLSTFSDCGANVTLNVKAKGGKVYGLSAINANAAVRYIQLFNTATVPATGVTVPDFCFPLAATSGSIQLGQNFFPLQGASFPLGIAYGFSTTQNVYTAGTAANGTVQVIFQ